MEGFGPTVGTLNSFDSFKGYYKGYWNKGISRITIKDHSEGLGGRFKGTRVKDTRFTGLRILGFKILGFRV